MLQLKCTASVFDVVCVCVCVCECVCVHNIFMEYSIFTTHGCLAG